MFHLIWNARGRLEVLKTNFFPTLQVENKIISRYKISCLHPKRTKTKWSQNEINSSEKTLQKTKGIDVPMKQL
jgi:hypothetical protein